VSPPPSGSSSRAMAVTVVDPRWVLPVPAALVGPGPRPPAGGHGVRLRAARRVRLGVSDALRTAGCDVPQRDVSLPQEFLDHGSRGRRAGRRRADRRRTSRAGSPSGRPRCPALASPPPRRTSRAADADPGWSRTSRPSPTPSPAACAARGWPSTSPTTGTPGTRSP
jgi:hypothetical protein